MKTSRFHKSLQLLISLALSAGLALTPTRPAYAATHTVNSLADTNDGTCNVSNCTLREAITAANGSAGADTIQFSVSGIITTTTDLPGILAAGGMLTIDGSARNVDISGNRHHRVLYIASGGKLNLKNLDIRNGYTTNSGAGVYNNTGQLTIEGVTLANNRADGYGGAIYNSGTLTVTNTNFSSNSVDTGSGGAIYVYTNTLATISNAMFYDNYANGGGGAIYNLGHLNVSDTDFQMNNATHGGAIYNRLDLTIQDAVFGLNSASNYGGAFYNTTGGLFEIDRCDFVWNSAEDGGGVYIFDEYGSSHIYDSTLNGNHAYGDGGGLYNLRGDFAIRTSLIKSNHADGNGGGVYNSVGQLVLIQTTLKSNSSDQNGGGVYNFGYVLVEDSTLSGNQAVGYGGGVLNEGTTVSSIKNSTFYDNRAAKGGGVYNYADLFLISCTIAANRADTSGGGIFEDGSTWIHHSIIANSVSGENCGYDPGEPYPTNSGNNIDSGASCHWGSNKGSMSNTNPLLGPLQFNGGWTDTMALRAGSPAVDGVTYDSGRECPEDDQRGYPRPFGVRCDIGAFERYYRLFMPEVMKN